MSRSETTENRNDSPGSNGGLFVTLIVLALIGSGIGTLFKAYFLSPGDEVSVVDVHKSKKKPDISQRNVGNSKAAHSNDQHGEQATLQDLKPIVTNLAKPKGTWVRLEASLLFESEPDKGREVVGELVGNDFLAFLRTVSLGQIEGAVGLEYLTDDLSDIARIRSRGKVQRVIIRGLIVE